MIYVPLGCAIVFEQPGQALPAAPVTAGSDSSLPPSAAVAYAKNIKNSARLSEVIYRLS